MAREIYCHSTVVMEMVTLIIIHYPTVVMETNAHQNPSHEPLKKLRGNCSSLNQVS